MQKISQIGGVAENGYRLDFGGTQAVLRAENVVTLFILVLKTKYFFANTIGGVARF